MKRFTNDRYCLISGLTLMTALSAPLPTTLEAQTPAVKASVAPQGLPENGLLANVEHLNGAPDPSSLVGLGFRFNAENGTFEPTQMIAELVILAPDAISTDEIAFGRTFNSQDVFEYVDLTETVWGSLFAIKAAMQYAHQSVHSEQYLGVGFTYHREIQYKDKIADLSPQNVVFTPVAESILQIQDPAVREYTWRETFGDFVALGYTLRGSAGIKVSLLRHDSYRSRADFLDLRGEFLDSTSDWTFGSLAEEAKRRRSLSLSVEAEGAAIPADVQLPAVVESIDEEWEQQAFVNNLNTLALNAKAEKGVILFPGSVLPGAPTLSGPDWNISRILLAQQVAEDAKNAMEDAYHWTYPLSLRQFLDVRQSPGFLDSYSEVLHIKRMAVLDGMEAMWIAVKEYLEEQTPQNEAAITATAAVAQSRTTDLRFFLIQLHDLANGLPPVELRVYEWIDQPAGQAYWIQTRIDFELENVGFFEDWRLGGLEDALQYIDPGTGRAAVTLYENQPGNPGAAHTYGNDMKPFEVLEEEVIHDGAGQGLRKIRFTSNMAFHSQSPTFQVVVEDDLKRLVSQSVTVSDDNAD